MSNNRYDYGKITLVKGVIETADGNYSEFTIATDGAWQQWGASTERLGHTVGAMEAMSRALMAEELLASDTDEEEPEEYALALLVGVHRDRLAAVTNGVMRLGLTAETDGTGWRTWSEPVDEDENDGVTHLVRIEVASDDQAHHVANLLDNLGLLSDAVTDRDQAAAEEIVGGPCQVMGYVTNAHTYCEGYHRMLVRTGEGPLTEHDLLGR